MSSAATNSVALIHLRRKLILAVGLIVAVASFANAQTAVASPIENASSRLPRFEVATIKPVGPDGPHMVGVHVYPGGRLVITTLTLKDLIAAAFDLSYWQISGGSGWMEKDRYDIQAEAPKTPQSALMAPEYAWSTLKNKQMQLMLQALLIDRFQLKFHRETKTGTVYILEKSGKTLKLRPTKATANSVYPSGDIGASSKHGWGGHDTSLAQLAKYSSTVLRCPVQDQAGMDEYFDFESKTIPTNANFQNPDDMNSSFLAMIKEVGLRLKPTKGPVETFVIDHAEQPSPN
jgi:uncharacterized protein (TIGR03435 family)